VVRLHRRPLLIGADLGRALVLAFAPIRKLKALPEAVEG